MCAGVARVLSEGYRCLPVSAALVSASQFVARDNSGLKNVRR